MRLRHCLPLLALIIAVAAPVARAEVQIKVDKSIQQMTVTINGEQLYTWPVSTGLSEYDTPAGEFQPFRMERHHFSREWDDAPMPHSIFFTQDGHAIHGSYHVKNLGKPASHGCVRLAPENARTLFDLVKKDGVKNAKVTLTGETPPSPAGSMAGAGYRGDRDFPGVSGRAGADITAALPGRRAARRDDARVYYRDPYYPRRTYGFGFPFGW